jgi:hypothetical protein
MFHCREPISSQNVARSNFSLSLPRHINVPAALCLLAFRTGLGLFLCPYPFNPLLRGFPMLPVKFH